LTYQNISYYSSRSEPPPAVYVTLLTREMVAGRGVSERFNCDAFLDRADSEDKLPDMSLSSKNAGEGEGDRDIDAWVYFVELAKLFGREYDRLGEVCAGLVCA
jgi:hypothetical protein